MRCTPIYIISRIFCQTRFVQFSIELRIIKIQNISLEETISYALYMYILF